MTDRKRELAAESDRLLAALDEIRSMESRKRKEDISSPEFQELAEKIHEKSREIFLIAAEQERIGGEFSDSDDSIDDIAASESDDPLR